jgi:hypothetical protein
MADDRLRGMSKKDYQRIAQAISLARTVTAYDHPGTLCVATLLEKLVAAFAQDNPRFDRARFVEACGGMPR